MKDYLLAVAGSDIDYFYETEKFLTPGDACLCTPSGVKAGGCILNVAAAAAHKGLKTRVIDHLKEEDSGTDLIINTLNSHGVITEDIQKGKDDVNGSCIIFKKGDEKCIYVIDPKHPFYEMDDKMNELLEGARYIYTLPRILSICFSDTDYFRELKKKGVKIFFDGSSQFSDPIEVKIIEELADGLFINTQSYERLKEKLEGRKLNCDFICLTDGDKGADCITNEKVVHHDAFRVEVKDSTGAGDSFAGCFIACLNASFTYEQALEYACASGAMACRVDGGMCSTFSLADIREFIDTYR